MERATRNHRARTPEGHVEDTATFACQGATRRLNYDAQNQQLPPEDPKDEMNRKLQQEIQELKQQRHNRRRGTPPPPPPPPPQQPPTQEELLRRVQQLERQLSTQRNQSCDDYDPTYMESEAESMLRPI